MNKKICVVTGNRAEYGLLYWLMKGIRDDDSLELKIIVTGTHLSPEFGLTYKEIEKDFKINKKIEMVLSSDTSIGISKSMGLAQISFSEAFNELKPDAIVLLGDRYEMLSAAAAAMITNISIVHLHGGEVTEGAFDEAIRHSITKMSHIHFTTTDNHRKRVIQLGEKPENVFNVGGMGVENVKKLNLMSRNDFEKSIDFKLNIKNVLVTFHPTTLEDNTSEEHFIELLNALDTLKNTNIIFTKANSDTNGRIINKMIDEYVVKRSNCVSFKSLGQLRYLSALRYVDAVVGNSSSGLLEAPTFKIGTINIGDRQKGRTKAISVIDCDPNKKSILNAFERLYSDDFKNNLHNTTNPYGNAEPSLEMIKVLKMVNFKNLLKKSFYDIDFKI